jgi:hypothetical protein
VRFAVLLFLLVALPDATSAQSRQVPLETPSGWGAVQAPEGYKALRIQGTSKVPANVLAALFADFAAHPTMFPRVVDRVEILSCEGHTLKMRFRTKFDPRPGGKTEVESLSTMKAHIVSGERIEFTWASSEVKSDFVRAAWGRALFVQNGNETLVDYVSAVRPRNAAKGVLVESQKGVLASDAKYVIDRLIALGQQGAAATSQSQSIRLCKSS